MNNIVSTTLNEFVNESEVHNTSASEMFGLEQPTSIKDVETGILSILSQYSGRTMAAIQAQKWLEEMPANLAKEWLAINNITSREELRTKIAKMQIIARKGHRKQQSVAREKIKQDRSEFVLNDIMRLAAEAEEKWQSSLDND